MRIVFMFSLMLAITLIGCKTNLLDHRELKYSYSNSQLFSRSLNHHSHPDHKTGAEDVEMHSVSVMVGKTILEGDSAGFPMSLDAIVGPRFSAPVAGPDQDATGIGLDLDIRVNAHVLSGDSTFFVGLNGGYMYTHHDWNGQEHQNLFRVAPVVGVNVPFTAFGCKNTHGGSLILSYALEHISDFRGRLRFDNDGYNTDTFSLGIQFPF